MNNFWREQKDKHSRGLVVLAPMADVTDNPFRRILSEVGAPDVFWNEFVSADGLAHEVARPKIERMLSYNQDQRPIIAQIFSGDADNCKYAGALCAERGFDGVDINMGCPVRNIIKQVSGSELTKTEHRERVHHIIEATREGAGDKPVSVKTRLGFTSIDMSWVQFLLDHNLPCLTLHLRTRQEMSKVAAHWELVDEVIAMRDRVAPETLLIANGDISNRREAIEKITKHPGLDGVMIGRGVLQDPWAFHQDSDFAKTQSVQARIDLALRHTRYFIEEYSDENGKLNKSFNVMKKFYKLYINGFDGAKDVRVRLMACGDYKEVEQVCSSFSS